MMATKQEIRALMLSELEVEFNACEGVFIDFVINEVNCTSLAEFACYELDDYESDEYDFYIIPWIYFDIAEEVGGIYEKKLNKGY